MPLKNKAWYFFYYSAFCISILFLACNGKQSEFSELAINWIICFFFFGILIYFKVWEFHPHLWWLVPLFIKIFLVFIPPELSNDYIRFWWDGYLSQHGINPYLHTPSEILQIYTDEPIAEALKTNYPKLNSKDYHTVYPPFSQLLFYISAIFSGAHLFSFSAYLKLLYLLADCLTLLLILKILKKSEITENHAFLYFANPLCIIELQGNLHTEQFMVLFLAIAIYASMNAAQIHLFWGLCGSVLAKLNALLLFPLFVNRFSGIRRYFVLFVSCLVLMLFLYLPISGNSTGFGQSIGLYFQEFEFNSLFYAYVRDYLFDHKYYELKTNLGWILLGCYAVIATTIFLHQFIRKIQNTFAFASAWWILFLFYMMSSTVHPWYICPILFLGVFYLPLSSLAWSFVIFFSYSHYDPESAAHYRLISGLAYMILFVCIYFEQRSKPTSQFVKS